LGVYDYRPTIDKVVGVFVRFRRFNGIDSIFENDKANREFLDHLYEIPSNHIPYKYVVNSKANDTLYEDTDIKLYKDVITF
jgi:hypothetical protein